MPESRPRFLGCYRSLINEGSNAIALHTHLGIMWGKVTHCDLYEDVALIKDDRFDKAFSVPKHTLEDPFHFFRLIRHGYVTRRSPPFTRLQILMRSPWSNDLLTVSEAADELYFIIPTEEARLMLFTIRLGLRENREVYLEGGKNSGVTWVFDGFSDKKNDYIFYPKDDSSVVVTHRKLTRMGEMQIFSR